MAENYPPPGGINISGGQVNIGGGNPSFTQYNSYGSAEALDEFRRLLHDVEQRLSEFPHPAVAERQIQVVEVAMARRDPAARPVVQGALTELAAQVTAGATLAESIARAAELVVRFWPFSG